MRETTAKSQNSNLSLKVTTIKKSIIGIIAITLLSACKKSDGICQFLPIGEQGWNKKDTMLFEVPASTQEADYDVLLLTRVTRQFAHRDLWVVVEQEFGNTDSIDSNASQNIRRHTDTIQIDIADKNGYFIGKGRDLLEYSTPIRFVRLKEGDGATFRIHHLQNTPNVTGVHDIGIEVSALEKK